MSKYSDFHYHQPSIPKGKDTKNRMKLWDLKWNKQNIVTAQPYGVCVAKKKELVKAKTHSEHLFTITEHK